MRLFTLLLLLCSVTAYALEDGERDRLHEEFSTALTELSESQKRLSDNAGTAQVVVPPGVQTTIATRRTQAAEWIRRLGVPTGEFPVDEADMFRDGLNGLRGRLDTVSSWLETLSSLGERWPKAIGTKELERYRTFVRGSIEQRLQEISTDMEPTIDDGVLWQRQRRHEIILQVIESTGQAGDRWSQVPKDAPILREYLEHGSNLRAIAERGLQLPAPGDDRDLDRDEAILALLDELVQLAQTRSERLAERPIPPTNQLLIAFTNALALEEKAVRALIALRKTPNADEGAQQRQEEDLRHERDQRGRVSGLVWDCLGIDLETSELRKQLAEIVVDAPPENQTQSKARLQEIDQAQNENTQMLIKAVEVGSRIDLITAKYKLRGWQRNIQSLIELREQSRERKETEQEWRTHAAQPAVAAALAKLDAAWAAQLAANARQTEVDFAAIRADHARELAEVAAEDAQIAAQRSQRDLDQAREQLELRRQEVIDAVENPQPKPEGDTKF